MSNFQKTMNRKDYEVAFGEEISQFLSEVIQKCPVEYSEVESAEKEKIIINILDHMKNDFIMTYGDGLSNINIKKLINFHYKNKSQVTLTAVRPKQRYGILKIQKKKVRFFDNSKKKSDVYINGGFFVISKDGIKKIKNKDTYWEKEPLSFFLKKKKLFAFKHEGFWKSLDTLKDKNDFNEMIKKNKLPWKNI